MTFVIHVFIFLVIQRPDRQTVEITERPVTSYSLSAVLPGIEL